MPQLPQTEKKHRDIVKMYTRLSSVKEFGVQKFTTPWCIHKIADQFYMAPATVEGILFRKR